MNSSWCILRYMRLTVSRRESLLSWHNLCFILIRIISILRAKWSLGSKLSFKFGKLIEIVLDRLFIDRTNLEVCGWILVTIHNAPKHLNYVNRRFVKASSGDTGIKLTPRTWEETDHFTKGTLREIWHCARRHECVSETDGSERMDSNQGKWWP